MMAQTHRRSEQYRLAVAAAVRMATEVYWFVTVVPADQAVVVVACSPLKPIPPAELAQLSKATTAAAHRHQ
jgi:hypothetical protein